MLTLKLQRVGKKHQPEYRLVVDEKRHKLVGNKVEYLGWYSPQRDKIQFNKERVLYWLKNGVQKTDTVHNLLVREGIIEEKKIAVHKKSKTTKVEAPTPAVEEKK